MTTTKPPFTKATITLDSIRRNQNNFESYQNISNESAAISTDTNYDRMGKSATYIEKNENESKKYHHINDFDTKKLLGSGMYGSVYLVHSKRFDCDFALKEINKDPKASKSVQEQMRREAEILKTVCHDNVVRLYDFYEDEQKFYMVMEHCPNGTLLKLIQQRSRLTKDEVRDFFYQIISALNVCHKSGITHRDIKPENILIDAHGRPKIGDWGQSRMFKSEQLLVTYCGTVSYASPEVHNELPYCGPPSDMWAIGVCLYASIVGQLPWAARSTKLKIEQIITASYTIPPDIDEDIADIIRNLLVIDPNKRLTAEEVLDTPFFKDMTQSSVRKTSVPLKTRSSQNYPNFQSHFRKAAKNMIVSAADRCFSCKRCVSRSTPPRNNLLI